MNDKQRKDFEEFLENDFSFEIPGLARFRVNAFNQARGASAVFRTIPSKVLRPWKTLAVPPYSKRSLMCPVAWFWSLDLRVQANQPRWPL